MSYDVEDFEHYFDLVISPISYSVLPDKLYYYAEQRLYEIVKKMYRLNVDYKIASVMMEEFLNQFRGMIVIPISEEHNYLSDESYFENE